jgi:hypothetical protein
MWSLAAFTTCLRMFGCQLMANVALLVGGRVVAEPGVRVQAAVEDAGVAAGQDAFPQSLG